ncbi:unnamed protein product, partial [Ectocarpus sp. 12 AP-2014]
LNVCRYVGPKRSRFRTTSPSYRPLSILSSRSYRGLIRMLCDFQGYRLGVPIHTLGLLRQCPHCAQHQQRRGRRSRHRKPERRAVQCSGGGAEAAGIPAREGASFRARDYDIQRRFVQRAPPLRRRQPGAA